MAKSRRGTNEKRRYNPRRTNLGDLFIRSLADHIIVKYHKRHEKLREELSEGVDYVYFVHELCECAKKRGMRELYPELNTSHAYEPAIMLGELVHLGVESLTYSEKEVVKFRDVETKIGTVRVAGTIDIYHPESETVLEVKYARKLDSDTPLEHHKLQASLYAWLANAKTAEIWYITPEGMKMHGKIEPASRDEVETLITDGKAPMWPKWECKYCQYVKVC